MGITPRIGLRSRFSAFLLLGAVSLSWCGLAWADADTFAPGYDTVRCGGVSATRRGAINFTDAGATCTDDSANNETEVSGLGAGSGAPTTAEYVVTEANASLSAEVAPSATDQVPNSSSSTAGSWTNSPNLLDLTLQGAGPDISFIGTGLKTMGLHQDGDSSLVFRNETDSTDILYLKPGGGVRLPGFSTCNLDTDASGLLVCGTDATGSSNSFETIAVPAGTNPVADSATDTLTITETSFLTITGTAATDTIDITQVTTDLGTDGLIAADAVALGTDTTNNYVATIADAGNSTITVANSGTETAAVTLDAVDLNCTGCLSATELGTDSVSADELNATGVEAELESTLDIAGEVSSTGMASTVIADSVAVTSWNLTTPTITTSLTTSTPTTLSAAELDRLDGLAGVIVTDTTATTEIDGRGLTISGATLVADAELYTDTKCIWWENPVAGDDFKSVWIADNYAVTVTRLWCESDQTVNTMLQVDDGSPADMDSVDLACISTPDTDTALDGDATIAAGDRVDVDVASVSGTPTWVSVCFTFTRDD